MDVLAKFGKRLRDLRTQAGVSQEAFAGKCGLDRTYISGIDRGKRNVSLRNLQRIATALGVPLAEVFRGI